MKLSKAFLHTPFFFVGKNFGMKLEAGQGIELAYDRDTKELAVTYKGKTAYLPASSVNSYEEGLPEPKPAPITGIGGKPVKAQVSVPPGMKNE